jgi:hypothetical protein
VVRVDEVGGGALVFGDELARQVNMVRHGTAVADSIRFENYPAAIQSAPQGPVFERI